MSNIVVDIIEEKISSCWRASLNVDGPRRLLGHPRMRVASHVRIEFTHVHAKSMRLQIMHFRRSRIHPRHRVTFRLASVAIRDRSVVVSASSATSTMNDRRTRSRSQPPRCRFRTSPRHTIDLRLVEPLHDGPRASRPGTSEPPMRALVHDNADVHLWHLSVRCSSCTPLGVTPSGVHQEIAPL